MRKREALLIAASAAIMAIFVGCTTVENNLSGNLEQIQMEIVPQSTVLTNAVTTRETTSTEVVAAETSTSSQTTTTATSTSTVTTSIKMAGQSQTRGTQAPTVITQVVVVTVTAPPKQTTAPPVSTTVTTVATEPIVSETEPPTDPIPPEATTLVAPDGIFAAERDLLYVAKDREFRMGAVLPDLADFAYSIQETASPDGAELRYLYQMEDVQLLTAVRGAEEVLIEVKLTGPAAQTPKGIAVGDPVEKVREAYGDQEVLEYRSEDGRLLEFLTDGYVVTEIRYAEPATE